MTCQATRQSDEMVCAKCRLRWDVSDPEPPLCANRPVVVATRDLGERLEYVSALAPDRWR